MAVPAAQYLRVSTEQQQYSLENQAEAIRDYATRLGFAIVQTYSDTGRSGLRLKDRPGIIRLISDVMSGHAIFRTVLVYDVSRWGDSRTATKLRTTSLSVGVPVYQCITVARFSQTITPYLVRSLRR